MCSSDLFNMDGVLNGAVFNIGVVLNGVVLNMEWRGGITIYVKAVRACDSVIWRAVRA